MSCCFCSSSLFLCVTSWWLFSPSNFTAVNKKHTDCFSTIMTWQWDSSQTFCGCQATPVTPYTIYGHLLFWGFFKCTFPLLLLPLSLFLLILTSLHLYQVFFLFLLLRLLFSVSHRFVCLRLRLFNTLTWPICLYLSLFLLFPFVKQLVSQGCSMQCIKTEEKIRRQTGR